MTLDESGETAIERHVAFDRDAATNSPIILRLLHAAVAGAIDLGCKRVSLGRTAIEPKAALSAKPQAFIVLVRHRQPLLIKSLKRPLLDIEHVEAPECNPFQITA